MSKHDTDRLQPPIPSSFAVPPLVQPQWRLSDLFSSVKTNIREQLQQELCRQYGVKHCILLDRARSGLYLLIEGMGLKGGWISTSLMHRPTTVLLSHHVSDIALADVKRDFTMDTESATSLISPQTEGIFVTHMYGKAADIQQLRKLADAHGLFLVENAVHMPGNVRVGNKPLGSWGDAALLSFNVDKPLGGILGGALLTNRDDVFEAAQCLPLGKGNRKEVINRISTTYLAYRWKPLTIRVSGNKYRRPVDGVAAIEAFAASNYRRYTPHSIHRLQAAVAYQCLQRLPEISQKRMANGQRLLNLLADAPDLELPESSASQPHSFLYFPILFQNDRYEIGESLTRAGIETKWRYHPIHLQEGFSHLRHHGLSTTEDVWKRHLTLPCGLAMKPSHLMFMAECLMDSLKVD